MSDASRAVPRLLVAEDEYLIRMLLADMLADLGYEVAAAVGTIAEASELAASGDFNAAILDLNLDGQEIYPVAEILGRRCQRRCQGGHCRPQPRRPGDLSGRGDSGQARPKSPRPDRSPGRRDRGRE